MPVLAAAMGFLGLAIGSFLNVVIYRVPRHQSLLRPGSHCPACDAAIRPRHNIPVVGYLWLAGRCGDCDARISVRYPVVELATSLLFVAMTVQLGRLGMLEALPAYLFFAAVGVALTVIDLDVKRLPNVIVYPAFAVLVALLCLASALEGSVEPLVRAIIGAAALFVFYLGLVLAYPAGMGLGDVKLAAVIGAALGFLSYPALVIGAFAAFLIGGVVGAGLVVARRASGKTAVPFGPFMISGALIAVFASAPLADSYVRLVLSA